MYFQAQGYNVATALSGREALDKSRTESPDLILLDVRLPDMDGFEIGKHLQDDPRTCNLPVIFVTERRERDDRITGLKLGAIDYITKPFDVQELRLRVRNALRRVGSHNNPVTGLPGEKLTKERLASMLEAAPWAVVGVRITGLDKFNEIYGFVARDDVLRAVALTLTSVVDELGTVDDFVGHPEENEFIIITAPDKSAAIEQQIRQRLNQAMTYFYPIHDREAGYVLLSGKDGPREKVPFMKLATAILSSQTGSFSGEDHLRQTLKKSFRV